MRAQPPACRTRALLGPRGQTSPGCPRAQRYRRSPARAPAPRSPTDKAAHATARRAVDAGHHRSRSADTERQAGRRPRSVDPDFSRARSGRCRAARCPTLHTPFQGATLHRAAAGGTDCNRRRALEARHCRGRVRVTRRRPNDWAQRPRRSGDKDDAGTAAPAHVMRAAAIVWPELLHSSDKPPPLAHPAAGLRPMQPTHSDTGLLLQSGPAVGERSREWLRCAAKGKASCLKTAVASRRCRRFLVSRRRASRLCGASLSARRANRACCVGNEQLRRRAGSRTS